MDYSFNACKLQINGDELRIALPRSPRKFIIGFGCVFIPFLVVFSWYFIPEPVIRWLFMILGPLVAGFMFAFLLWLQNQHERLGDYLIGNRATKTITLPRCNRQFSFEQAVGLQWICGRTGMHIQVDVDLNLLVTEGAEVVRYLVMGNPSRRLVDQLAAFTGLRLEVIDLGWRGYRDAERE